MARNVGSVLLIGGGGFIGAHVARELLQRGREVVVLDDDRTYLPGGEPAAMRARAWRRRELLTGAELRGGGPDDPALLARELRRAAPDAVVHLANLPLAGVAAADPATARRSIVDGTANVLRALARHAPAARLTFVSSSMVYGDFSQDPQPETAPLAPCEPYGACKLEAERLVRASALAWTIVRPSAVYGPGDANGRFLQRLVEAATTGGTLQLTADPATRLDFTWVQDLARGLADAATSPHAVHETFNVTAGHARSLGEAIDVVRARGHTVAIRRRPPTTLRPRRGSLDIERARSLLGYRPRCTLEDGLAAYLDAAARLEPVA
ncbi:MAG: UDP-glucose 4-epimerase [Solirubrobacteraceae bacterium]|jgi:nucleoside-diphosphate-sugar epimerase|nr:UDP-glucose 4-epimerase [Solirubrobacteraceae bacterium]